jgi:hypothetical protein
MDYGWNDDRPTAYESIKAVATSQAVSHTSVGWLWLDKFIPYCDVGNYFHWFKRFDDI